MFTIKLEGKKSTKKKNFSHLLNDSQFNVLLRCLFKDIIGFLQCHVAGVNIIDRDNGITKF